MPPRSRQQAAAKKVRRKERKNVAHGHAHIRSTFNNTIISITDPTGNVISWASAGQVGFKGSRKSTPYAAQMAAEAAARRAMEHGMRKVDVFVKGPGSGRETAIRSLQATGLEVGSIQDMTPVPHNGCRPPKRRRAMRFNSQYATNATIRTPISVKRIKTSGELPSHQRILVSGFRLPTVYSAPTRKLVTLSGPATIKSPWISGLRS